jgi:hypothetical protein
MHVKLHNETNYFVQSIYTNTKEVYRQKIRAVKREQNNCASSGPSVTERRAWVRKI